MAFARRRSTDVSTAFENTGFARTRVADSEIEWDVELHVRERGRSIPDTDHGHNICA
jgi:hypothetical protein